MKSCKMFVIALFTLGLLATEGALAQEGNNSSRDGSWWELPYRERGGMPPNYGPGTGRSGPEGQRGYIWYWNQEQREKAARNRGVISVGRRPDGTRAEAPDVYAVWEEVNGKKVLRRMTTNFKEAKLAFEEINLDPDRRAYRKEFTSFKDAGNAVAQESAGASERREEAERRALAEYIMAAFDEQMKVLEEQLAQSEKAQKKERMEKLREIAERLNEIVEKLNEIERARLDKDLADLRAKEETYDNLQYNGCVAGMSYQGCMHSSSPCYRQLYIFAAVKRALRKEIERDRLALERRMNALRSR